MQLILICFLLMAVSINTSASFPPQKLDVDSADAFQYPLSDPRNPNCPCHEFQKLADKEFKNQQEHADTLVKFVSSSASRVKENFHVGERVVKYSPTSNLSIFRKMSNWIYKKKSRWKYFISSGNRRKNKSEICFFANYFSP